MLPFFWVRRRNWLLRLFFILPLARKLKNCGVFGVGSDEYLSYAVKKSLVYREDRKDESFAEMEENMRTANVITELHMPS